MPFPIFLAFPAILENVMLLTNGASQVYSAVIRHSLMPEDKKRHGCAGVTFFEHKRQRSKLLLIA